MRWLRALPLAFVALLALPSLPSGAHPGHGEYVVVNVGGFQFSPPQAEVTAGEEVLWSWIGPDRNHSVTSDAGQASQAADKGFVHRFTTPGTYTYHCTVHDQMHGKIVVDPPPPPDPAPQLVGLRAPSRARARVTLRFALSEPSVVLLEVDALKGGRPAKLVLSRSTSLPAGQAVLPVSVRRLRRGTYRFRLVPVDVAQNAGAPADARVKLVR
jgi:plastocyanin